MNLELQTVYKVKQRSGVRPAGKQNIAYFVAVQQCIVIGYMYKIVINK